MSNYNSFNLWTPLRGLSNSFKFFKFIFKWIILSATFTKLFFVLTTFIKPTISGNYISVSFRFNSRWANSSCAVMHWSILLKVLLPTLWFPAKLSFSLIDFPCSRTLLVNLRRLLSIQSFRNIDLQFLDSAQFLWSLKVCWSLSSVLSSPPYLRSTYFNLLKGQ